jgi:hypothetical protein
MVTHFRQSLVLAYALPAEVLAPLVPPGLSVDSYGEHRFVAIALVQTARLRPSRLPAWVGQSYFLSGYRIFVRHQESTGRMRRGLHIIRSDTNRRSMVLGGNALTRYNYRLADIAFVESAERLEVEIRTPRAEADLHVIADMTGPAALPIGSPFTGTDDARRFAGPLPWTFDYEPESHSIIMIRGRRTEWHPEPIRVEVKECSFFQDPRFAGVTPILANAFHVSDLEYRWDRGVRVPLDR